MPKLEDLLKDIDKSKLKNMKHSKKLNFVGQQTIYPKASEQMQFVGETPNLNSSLGINAADGVAGNTGITSPTTTTAPVTSSKVDTFFQKNANVITGLGGTLLGGLFGSSAPAPSTDPGYTAPPPIAPSKKILGMPAGLFWVIAVVVVIVAGVVIYKKTRK